MLPGPKKDSQTYLRIGIHLELWEINVLNWSGNQNQYTIWRISHRTLINLRKWKFIKSTSCSNAHSRLPDHFIIDSEKVKSKELCITWSILWQHRDINHMNPGKNANSLPPSSESDAHNNFFNFIHISTGDVCKERYGSKKSQLDLTI